MLGDTFGDIQGDLLGLEDGDFIDKVDTMGLVDGSMLGDTGSDLLGDSDQEIKKPSWGYWAAKTKCWSPSTGTYWKKLTSA